MDDSRVDIWTDFIKALDKHLHDKIKVDDFYFELLLKSALLLDKQNPKRVVCESYLYLLEHEHRLNTNPICLICQNKIYNKVSLMQGYKMTHPDCINQYSFDIDLILNLFNSKSTIDIEDKDINWLYEKVINGF